MKKDDFVKMNRRMLEDAKDHMEPSCWQAPMTCVNILGASEHEADAIQDALMARGMMSAVTLYDRRRAPDIDRLAMADVSLVVSGGGIALAKKLDEELDIPYVTGTFAGDDKWDDWLERAIHAALDSGKPQYPYKDFYRLRSDHPFVLIGDAVKMSSAGSALGFDADGAYEVLCPYEESTELLSERDRFVEVEDIASILTEEMIVITEAAFAPYVKNPNLVIDENFDITRYKWKEMTGEC